VSERPGENPAFLFVRHRRSSNSFQGTFHASPDSALWYGWSEMQRDLTEIKSLAAEYRDKAKEAAKRQER
jgi:hypothetical protein